MKPGNNLAGFGSCYGPLLPGMYDTSFATKGGGRPFLRNNSTPDNESIKSLTTHEKAKASPE